MEKTEWFILGIAFSLIAGWFVHLDIRHEIACGFPPWGEGWLENGSQPVTRADLWCINTEIYDPFIWLFIALWITCWINCGLKAWKEKKKKKIE